MAIQASKAVPKLRACLLALVVGAMVIVAGCSSVVDDDVRVSTRTYAYTAYDSTGAAVVQGTMRVDFREVEATECERDCSAFRLAGRWSFEQTRDAEQIGTQVGEGPLRGSVQENGEAYINLNPEVEDNNVTLRGEFEDGHLRALQGEWAYQSWTLINSGPFEAERESTL